MKTINRKLVQLFLDGQVQTINKEIPAIQAIYHDLKVRLMLVQHEWDLKKKNMEERTLIKEATQTLLKAQKLNRMKKSIHEILDWNKLEMEEAVPMINFGVGNQTIDCLLESIEQIRLELEEAEKFECCALLLEFKHGIKQILEQNTFRKSA